MQGWKKVRMKGGENGGRGGKKETGLKGSKDERS
jgi:hypothetical protein